MAPAADDWIAEQTGEGRDVRCYFNNDIHGHTIQDALTLRAMVAQAARHPYSSCR